MKEKFDWEKFDRWKEEWEENSEKKKFEDLKKLAEAEKDYKKSQTELNQLRPRVDPKVVLGKNSSEPDDRKIPLVSLDDFSLSLPVVSVKILPGGLTVKSEKETVEDISYHFKKAVEFMMGERLILMAVLQSDERAVIREIGGVEAADPLFTITKTGDKTYLIRLFKSQTLAYSHRHFFDLDEILSRYGDYLTRFSG